jgi:hypothetical protein
MKLYSVDVFQKNILIWFKKIFFIVKRLDIILFLQISRKTVGRYCGKVYRK